MRRSFPTSLPQPIQQRGAATLALTSLLFLVLAMTLVLVHRQLIFEQRSNQNQVRAAISQEAAQAGLEWAQALINSPRGINSACQASADVGTAGSLQTWRDLHRHYEAGTRLQRTRLGLSAACVRDGEGWRCHCPEAGEARPLPASDEVSVPGFVVQLSDHDVPGQLRVHTKGCSQAGPDCWDLEEPTPAGHAHTRLQAQLALVGGLRTAPASPLTALGSVNAVALGAHHPESGSSGVAIHAGGDIQILSPSISGIAGGTSSAGLVANDEDLAAASPEQLFSALWGMGMARWSAQSSVQTLSCLSDCGVALQSAIANRSNRMVFVPGDLLLEATGGPLVLGSAEEPLLLVVKGRLTLVGSVQLYGTLYAHEIHWNSAGPDAFVRGAAWSQSNVHSDSAPQFYFDSAVLERLRWNTGTFALLHGSWRDSSP